LIFARILGYLFDRYKQPAVIGEILAGVLLGSYFLGRLGGWEFSISNFSFQIPFLDLTSSEFTIFASMGIIFLLFLSGLETKFSLIKETEKTAILVAIFGVIIPLIGGIIISFLFGFSIYVGLVIGVILVATSVGITVRVLMDLHLLDSKVGVVILGSAVFDDVIGLILLAIIVGVGSPVLLGFEVAIFFLIFLFIGLKVMKKIVNIGENIHLPKALLSIALAILFIFAFFAEILGIAAIIGAFVAGLVLGDTIQSKKILKDVKAIGYGFFIPLFFVWVGANIDLSTFLIIGPLALVVIVIGILSKIGGSSLGAILGRMSLRESLQVGVGMVPRMEVALIVVTSAIAHGILVGDIANQLLAVTILLTIVTTVVTPLFIKAVCKKQFL
jgi:Kef-type K+ transport system membrane component KefB